MKYMLDPTLISSVIAETLDTPIEPIQAVGQGVMNLTIALSVVVIASNIAAIILVLVDQFRSRRPKNVSERFKEYKTTVGTVVSVHKVAYYIKRYKPEEEKTKNDNGGDENEKTVNNPADAPLEVRKIRYKVFYEFTLPDTGDLYSGDCYVYNDDEVSPGDIIEITYKPDDPMVNFTDYNIPPGYLADKK
ncbi:MAG: hypothetical protein IIZ59_01905 [Clostridia bacterium]|nr:hypothetical protein [Clostridia bacterium]